MMKNAFYVTRKGLKAAEEKLESIDKQIKEIGIAIGDSCKDCGNLAENSEYLMLSQTLSELTNAKLELEAKLRNVQFIEDACGVFEGKVGLGTTVFINYDGDQEKWTILGSHEMNIDKGIISVDAPIAKAMLGKQAGDTVPFNNSQIVIEGVEQFSY